MIPIECWKEPMVSMCVYICYQSISSIINFGIVAIILHVHDKWLRTIIILKQIRQKKYNIII